MGSESAYSALPPWSLSGHVGRSARLWYVAAPRHPSRGCRHVDDDKSRDGVAGRELRARRLRSAIGGPQVWESARKLYARQRGIS